MFGSQSMFGPQPSSTTRESKKEQPNKAADLLDLIQEVRQMKQELTSTIEAQREELTRSLNAQLEENDAQLRKMVERFEAIEEKLLGYGRNVEEQNRSIGKVITGLTGLRADFDPANTDMQKHLKEMDIHVLRKEAQERMHCLVIDGLDYNQNPAEDLQKVQKILDQVGFPSHVIGSNIKRVGFKRSNGRAPLVHVRLPNVAIRNSLLKKYPSFRTLNCNLSVSASETKEERSFAFAIRNTMRTDPKAVWKKEPGYRLYKNGARMEFPFNEKVDMLYGIPGFPNSHPCSFD